MSNEIKKTQEILENSETTADAVETVETVKSEDVQPEEIQEEQKSKSLFTKFAIGGIAIAVIIVIFLLRGCPKPEANMTSDEGFTGMSAENLESTYDNDDIANETSVNEDTTKDTADDDASTEKTKTVTKYVNVPGETQVVTVPGKTQYVEVPGETITKTVTKYVNVPGETQYIEIPGETQYVPVEVPKYVYIYVPVDNFVSVTEINISDTKKTMLVGDEDVITASVLPENATNQAIVWESSNDEVVIVSNGTLYAVSEGVSVVTAKSVDGEFTARCEVTVNAKTAKEPEVLSITLSSKSLDMEVGETEKIDATINPENATNKTITWYSSDSNIATVDENGNVLAIAEGVVTITATADNGVSDNCIITVSNAIPEVVEVTGISVSTNKLELEVDETKTIVASVLPENATNKELIWETNDSSIISVNNGEVTGLKAGNAMITIRSNNGLVANVEVIVTEKEPEIVEVSSITLSNEALDMEIGESKQINATINPENATNKTITWSSSDSSIATVDENGNVLAISEGVVTITATADNGVSNNCIITVSKPEPEYIAATEVSASVDNEIEVGETTTISVVVGPEDATDKSVTFESSDSNVVSVDENGNVTGISQGVADITITTADGAVTTVTIAVKEKVNWRSVTEVTFNEQGWGWYVDFTDETICTTKGAYKTYLAENYPELTIMEEGDTIWAE